MRKSRWELTKREAQILRWVAAGCEYKLIASKMACRETTIRFHVGQIMIKLDAYNNRHAVAIALRKSLLEVAEIPELTE